MVSEEELRKQIKQLEEEIFEKSKKIEESEKKYNDLMANANSIILRWDKDGIIRFINEFGESFFGFETSELIDKSVYGTLVPKAENSKSRIHKLMKDFSSHPEKYETIENRQTRKNGEKVWISWTNKVIKDEKGKILSILSIGNDITKIKQAEERLRESEEKYRELLENIKEGYFEVDLKGNFLFVNEAFCDQIQYSRDEILGFSYAKFTDDRHKELVFKEFNRVFKTKKEKGIVQVIFKKKNKRRVVIETSIYLRQDKKGEIIGFNGFTRDVTKLKNAEKRLKKSEQNYKDAYNRANMFKDIIIHDVNNILQIIQSSAEIYQISHDPADRNEMKNLIRKNVERGIILVHNARKLSQVEDSEITLEEVNLNQVLNATLEQLNEKFHGREILVEKDIFKEDIYVKANELLRDVFENILFNAVKYCDNEELKIFIKISRERDQNYIKLEFKDNGIGIENKRKESIFDKGNKDKESKGLGFGLSLVKKIVESYKGKIWVEDRIKGDYSKGSNFIILIPEIT